jgi:single-stranded DNA-binding protein
VKLTGILAADPQQRVMSGGLPVANAKIVVTSRFLSTTHAAVTTTLNLVFYGPMADSAKLFTEGMRVSIEGEIVARSTSPTEKRTTTEIIVRKIFRIYADHQLTTPPETTTVPHSESTGDDPKDWA